MATSPVRIIPATSTAASPVLATTVASQPLYYPVGASPYSYCDRRGYLEPFPYSYGPLPATTTTTVVGAPLAPSVILPPPVVARPPVLAAGPSVVAPCTGCGSVTRQTALVSGARPLYGVDYPYYGVDLGYRPAVRDLDAIRAETQSVSSQNEQLRSGMKARLEALERERLKWAEWATARSQEESRRVQEALRLQIEQERQRNAINMEKAMRYDQIRQQLETEERFRQLQAMYAIQQQPAYGVTAPIDPNAARGLPGPVAGGVMTCAKVSVLSGAGLAIGDFRTSDPYVKIFWNETDTGCKTAYKDSTVNPQWNEMFHLEVPSGVTQLKFVVYDYDTGNDDDFLGQGYIDVSALNRVNKQHTISLQPRPANADDIKLVAKNKGSLGTINVMVEWFPDVSASPNPAKTVRAPAHLSGAAGAPAAPGFIPQLVQAGKQAVGGFKPPF